MSPHLAIRLPACTIHLLSAGAHLVIRLNGGKGCTTQGLPASRCRQAARALLPTPIAEATCTTLEPLPAIPTQLFAGATMMFDVFTRIPTVTPDALICLVRAVPHRAAMPKHPPLLRFKLNAVHG